MYEVLEHEGTLEILDTKGKNVSIKKRQKVRYLQNNIIAYQDQAWGDGEILINYKCTPGTVVDRYRPAQKTLLLISLRETKKRGDIDEFYISWKTKDGYIRDKESWQTSINHRTKKVQLQIIFPEKRPPIKVWKIENIRKRKRSLEGDAVMQLPNKKWMVTWEIKAPRLNEQYAISWEW